MAHEAKYNQGRGVKFYAIGRLRSKEQAIQRWWWGGEAWRCVMMR